MFESHVLEFLKGGKGIDFFVLFSEKVPLKKFSPFCEGRIFYLEWHCPGYIFCNDESVLGLCTD